MSEGASVAGCPRTELTAAFLDGELDSASSEEFERHTRECPVCSAALLEQRRLLCLLDTAFDDTFGKRVKLPEDFTRRLRARAQNDLSGVRASCERRRAIKICAALAVAVFALLGFAAFEAIASPAIAAALGAGRLLGAAGHAAADAGSGAGLVLRAVGGRLVASGALALLELLAIAAAFVLLLRLIGAYHRARAGE
ncbi:MAG TPA: zf-HC2 domain-containing protein [Pyrinomonadaceae bacterium]|jgi:anti-sigma factor RsiW|nr:zf-HC2 domain-containing protein [Pyrinomonadaceae bacterium]